MPHIDQKYIDALLKEDVAAITTIYEKWGAECKRFVLSNNGNTQDADDLFQESLLTVLRKAKFKNFELTVPFGGYLYFIYRNKWIDTLRKQKNYLLRIQEIERYTDKYTSKEMANETELTNKKMQLFYACFQQLGEACKTLIGGRLKKKTSKEIMKQLNLPSSNAVDFRMHKCRKQLKKIIEQHPDFKELILAKKQ